MAASITANGASYHGDLTKAVTHLIAAAPCGKKYEYAGQWGIKIVGKEWLADSLARGMILDEASYHPSRSPEERGRGAVTQRRQPSPTLGKRTRESAPQAGNRRKLRRTASNKLGSQNDDIWADMGTGETGSGALAGAEWDERLSNTSEKPQNPQVQDHQVEKADEFTDCASRRQSNHADADMTFDGFKIHISGFDDRQTAILQTHLTAGGAILFSEEDMKGRQIQAVTNDVGEELSQQQRMIFLVPSTTQQQVLSELEKSPSFDSRHDEIMTDWWVEKCVFARKKVSFNTALCRPIGSYPIQAFSKLLICPTSFSGMDLLHFSKAVKLLGAHYDESLRPETSVLVCGGSLPNAEKLKYAMAQGIPIVSADWLWTCISSNTKAGYEQFLLIGSGKRAERANMEISQRKSISSHDKDRRKPKINMTDSSATEGRQEALRDVTSQTNSQQKSEHSQQSQPSKKPEPQTSDEASFPKENTNITLEAGVHTNQNHDVLAEDSPASEVDKINDAIAHIQARKLERSRSDIDATKSRRHRPLGRAVSNPSSLGAGVTSFAGSSGSLQRALDEAEEEDDLAPVSRGKDMPTMFRPSQALSYENEESAAAREKLSKQSGVALRDTSGMKRVESIGVARDVDVLNSMAAEKAAGKKRASRKR